MTNPLLTIGVFAKATGLTPSSLRYYDEVGLLSPADVDAVTGYRYYTPDLVRRARLIARMREAGLPIETMRTVLDASTEAAGEALRAFVAEQAQRTARIESTVGEILAAAAGQWSAGSPISVRVDGTELAAAIRQVQVAADSDPSSALSSVLLDYASGALDVMATNRYWLAARTIPLAGAEGAGRAVLGPADAAKLADRLENEREITLVLRSDGLTAAGDDFAVRDVAFPDHRAVVDGVEPPHTRALVGRLELLAAVESGGRAELDVCVAAGSVEVVADGMANRVDAAVTGTGVTVRLGSALLRRALTAAVGPQVAVAASAPNRPISIGSPYQRGFLALVMPIRQA